MKNKNGSPLCKLVGILIIKKYESEKTLKNKFKNDKKK